MHDKKRRKQSCFHTVLAHVATTTTTRLIVIIYLVFVFLKFSTILCIFSDIFSILCFWFLMLNKRARSKDVRTQRQRVTNWLNVPSVSRAVAAVSLARSLALPLPLPLPLSFSLCLSPCFALFSFSFLSVWVSCASVSVFVCVCVYLALAGKTD